MKNSDCQILRFQPKNLSKIFKVVNFYEFNVLTCQIWKQHSVTCKDMEGAAISYLCNMKKVPLICLKAVTDIVDGPAAAMEEFLANLAKSSKFSQCLLKVYILFLKNGKKLLKTC